MEQLTHNFVNSQKSGSSILEKSFLIVKNFFAVQVSHQALSWNNLKTCNFCGSQIIHRELRFFINYGLQKLPKLIHTEISSQKKGWIHELSIVHYSNTHNEVFFSISAIRHDLTFK